MLEQLNGEIFEIKTRLREYKKLKSLRESIETELDKKINERKEAIFEVEKEHQDVLNLEKNSVRALFLSITGKRAETLDREREEHLRAKAKYESCQMEIDELKKGLAEADNLLLRFGDVQKEYDDLLKEKETLMIQSESQEGRELGQKMIKVDGLKVDMVEIREAISAGEAALGSLEGVREKLGSAKNWGTWDLLGGGLISNIAKHSAIDEANTRAREVQQQLRIFKKELSDVNEFTEIQVNISAFASFADFFFDGLIADWFVQSKINDSLSHVQDAKNSIEDVVNELKDRLSQLESELETNEKRIRDILKS